MSDEARVLLDMATLADAYGETIRARKLRESATFIEGLEVQIMTLERRVVSLEEGECRFHCRMRKDMWKAGYLWRTTQVDKSLVDDRHLTAQYNNWRTQHDKQK